MSKLVPLWLMGFILLSCAAPTPSPPPPIELNATASTAAPLSTASSATTGCGRVDCGGAAPACCYDDQLGWSCAETFAACRTTEARHSMRCLGARDCPGQRCCRYGYGEAGTSCEADCGPGGTPVCASDGDCEGVYVTGAEGDQFAASECNVVWLDDGPYSLRGCALPL